MIEFQGVRKSFAAKVAVRELTLTIPPGELFALLGPNGAGKTTTLKMGVGLLQPDAGRVLVGGLALEGAPGLQARRLLGYVPDEPYVYDKLTGREFLAFVGRMHRLEPAAIEAGVARLAETFEMEWFLDQLCETYSHGMKQRVAISAALLPGPRAIIVDEPLVGLDPRSALLLRRIFRERVAGGAALLLSTHTIALAETLADRIGILQDGELRFVGTRQELHRQAGTARDLEEVFLRLTGDAAVLEAGGGQ